MGQNAGKRDFCVENTNILVVARDLFANLGNPEKRGWLAVTGVDACAPLDFGDQQKND